jgi:Fe-S cluster biosynthesis and repair protein YggX/Tfp pilus assembly protein PilF
MSQCEARHMSQLQDRINQFRKMANDDPENELGHYRLGQLLQEAGQHADAVASFRRTLELSPQFSKVYQLLGLSLLTVNQRDEAIKVLRQGFDIADERGDNMPRDEMARMLTELGESAPVSKKASQAAAGADGFRCQRPGCWAGSRARKLAKPPMSDEIGQRIFETVCADCWNEWLKNYSIKVINELRLDLSTDRGQEEYDRYMREFLGIEQ